MTFDEAFERVIGHEGKLSLDREDRGNWTSGQVGKGELKGTKYGISAMSYPDEDIENLSLDRAKEIYKRDFWDKVSGDNWHSSIVFQMFDAAVNSGIGNAIRFLQRAVDVSDDGSIGPVTIDAVRFKSAEDVLKKFLAERLIFMTNLSTWNLYGKGWARRIAQDLKYAAEDYGSAWYENVEVVR